MWVNESLFYCYVDEIGVNDFCNKVYKFIIFYIVVYEENVIKIVFEYDLILCSDYFWNNFIFICNVKYWMLWYILKFNYKEDWVYD